MIIRGAGDKPNRSPDDNPGSWGIDDHIDRHSQLKKDRRLLESIPGVGKVVSRTMLSVLHSRTFQKAGQLATYIGLIPRLQESGQWKCRSRLSKLQVIGAAMRKRVQIYFGVVRHQSEYRPQVTI
jgi:transposase